MTSGNNSYDEQGALVRLRRGVYAAFEEVFEHNKTGVYNFLRLLGARADEADEVLQEVFVKIWEKRKDVRTDRKIRPFLLTIARNQWINMRRRDSRYCTVEGKSGHLGESPEPGPSERMEKRETHDTVRRAVEELPDELRGPLVLSRFENMTYREISEMLGITHRAVEVRICKAYNKLRTSLVNLNQDGTSGK